MTTMNTESAGPMRKAMETIAGLRDRLAEYELGGRVAIVGCGLRAPAGINSLRGLWQVLVEARDVTARLQEERRASMHRLELFDAIPDRAGWLDDPFGFDAAFFSISPREARSIDPQHRLLLEVTWEAFENAGMRPTAAAERTGVFVGITSQDYRVRAYGPMSSHWTPGNGHCFAAGRVAYTYGFQGPTVAIDTACSSSLTAVHLARASLAARECDVAVVGGVNLIASAQSTAEISRTGALSSVGRCRPFDANADGFVRGEGCGVVVLKRLEDAHRDGDRVLGIIMGSAVNQDGPSAGLSAPNPRAQTALVRQALTAAGVGAENVRYVQAHGTGTPMGDPIEYASLCEALEGPKSRILLSSVKANLGHTEAGAGVLGLFAALCVLQQEAVPPQANFEVLNPRIASGPLTVPETLIPLPSEPAGVALVNSFGMSGSNACVVLSTDVEQAVLPNDEIDALIISARSPAALQHMAADIMSVLESGRVELTELAQMLAHGRSRMKLTVSHTLSDRAEALRWLSRVSAGEVEPKTADAPETSVRPRRRVIDLPTYPWQHKEFIAATVTPPL